MLSAVLLSQTPTQTRFYKVTSIILASMLTFRENNTKCMFIHTLKASLIESRGRTDALFTLCMSIILDLTVALCLRLSILPKTRYIGVVEW